MIYVLNNKKHHTFWYIISAIYKTPSFMKSHFCEVAKPLKHILFCGGFIVLDAANFLKGKGIFNPQKCNKGTNRDDRKFTTFPSTFKCSTFGHQLIFIGKNTIQNPSVFIILEFAGSTHKLELCWFECIIFLCILDEPQKYFLVKSYFARAIKWGLPYCK